MGLNLDALLDTEEITDSGNPHYAHIVDRGEDPRPAVALVMESMVTGVPLTALCGHTWVPSRDPTKYPTCPKCEEIFAFAIDYRT